jgi:hypothetical protein
MPVRNTQPESSQLSPVRRPGSELCRLPASPLAAAALSAACLLLPGGSLPAQTSPGPPAVPAHKHAAVTPGTEPSHAQPGTQPAQAAVATQPQPPKWPANDPPTAASVVWDSHGLRIVASNSSLAQILKDVSTKTGATLEGMGQDQRIFGAYGTGSVRDVLSQLLDGSGYNVLMIGDQGQGTPRRIVLSNRPTGPAAPPSRNFSPGTSSDAEPEEPQPPEPPPPPVQNVTPPSVPARTPQQMQELHQQQQQQNPQN